MPSSSRGSKLGGKTKAKRRANGAEEEAAPKRLGRAPTGDTCRLAPVHETPKLALAVLVVFFDFVFQELRANQRRKQLVTTASSSSFFFFSHSRISPRRHVMSTYESDGNGRSDRRSRPCVGVRWRERERERKSDCHRIGRRDAVLARCQTTLDPSILLSVCVRVSVCVEPLWPSDSTWWDALIGRYVVSSSTNRQPAPRQTFAAKCQHEQKCFH